MKAAPSPSFRPMPHENGRDVRLLLALAIGAAALLKVLVMTVLMPMALDFQPAERAVIHRQLFLLGLPMVAALSALAFRAAGPIWFWRSRSSPSLEERQLARVTAVGLPDRITLS